MRQYDDPYYLSSDGTMGSITSAGTEDSGPVPNLANPELILPTGTCEWLNTCSDHDPTCPEVSLVKLKDFDLSGHTW